MIAASWARTIGVALVLAAVAAHRAVAQHDSGGSARAPLPYGVPDDPAFTFLGATPASVTRAGVPADFAVALLSAVDSMGRLRDGFALGATLWSVIPGVTVPLDRYQRSRLAYAFANTQMSIGAARSGGDTAATDLGVGLRTTIFDRADPMRDTAFIHSLNAQNNRCLALKAHPGLALHGGPAAPTVSAEPARTRLDSLVDLVRQLSDRLSALNTRVDTESPAVLACAGAAIDSLREAWQRKHWNGLNLTAGLATGWRYPESTVRDRRALGWSVWAAASLPWRERAQLVANLQLDHRTAVTGSPGNQLRYGIRWLQGSSSGDLFVEVIEARRLGTVASGPRASTSWTAGAEVRVGPGVWLSFGIGSGFASAKRLILTTNTKWGGQNQARQLPS